MTRRPPDADLSPESLLMAYASAAFPMADPDTGSVHFYTCDPRCVIPLDERFHVPRSLRRVVRSGRFSIRVDTAFGAVVRACAHDRDEINRCWIGGGMVEAYERMHALGLAHSVEAWLDEVLVGGLYGVALNAAFFGESMFCRPDLGGRDASKVCLVHLVDRLRGDGFTLLDSQYGNPLIHAFGAVDIDAREYDSLLREALEGPGHWSAGR